jgi:ribonuclease HII
VKIREIGIDEAGKGPVIGSMFVAGVVNYGGLETLGVRDSKQVSPARREVLADRLASATEVFVLELTAEEIDRARETRTMNELLVELFAAVILHLRPDRAIVDAADVNPARFGAKLRARYEQECGRAIAVVSESKADVHYPVVSAASIVAKVQRDRSIRALESRLGVKIGSGYPADQVTIAYLQGLLRSCRYADIPGYVRKSWKTVHLYSPKRYD